MFVAALRVELSIPNVHSLKEKRRILKSIVTLVTKKFAVAVAEVGFQDKWQRSTLGVAAVAPQLGHLEQLLTSVERLIDAQADVEIIEIGVCYLENPE